MQENFIEGEKIVKRQKHQVEGRSALVISQGALRAVGLARAPRSSCPTVGVGHRRSVVGFGL